MSASCKKEKKVKGTTTKWKTCKYVVRPTKRQVLSLIQAVFDVTLKWNGRFLQRKTSRRNKTFCVAFRFCNALLLDADGRHTLLLSHADKKSSSYNALEEGTGNSFVRVADLLRPSLGFLRPTLIRLITYIKSHSKIIWLMLDKTQAFFAQKRTNTCKRIGWKFGIVERPGDY